MFRNSVGFIWYLAHANESFFHVGDRLRKGQHIQDSGQTGFSTGPHTHIGLLPARPNWANGAFGHIDPAPFIREKYRPLTYVSWQGAPTEGVGATTTKKDWFDMATKEELRDVVEAVVQRELTYKREKLGAHAGGSVSLQDEVLNLASNFAAVRGDIRAVMAAVSPATLEAVIRQCITPGAQLDPAVLADLLAPALLKHILTTNTEGA